MLLCFLYRLTLRSSQYSQSVKSEHALPKMLKKQNVRIILSSHNTKLIFFIIISHCSAFKVKYQIHFFFVEMTNENYRENFQNDRCDVKTSPLNANEPYFQEIVVNSINLEYNCASRYVVVK